MNRLQYESSPYLLQHARNPVDWYAWKPEAFERARLEDKPILVSIGYSTCHWCHVMERESFEDEATAAFMNDNFVNIKVDREERPDVDQIYMEACQALTGQGGWPLNCFLLPDGRPFYAGTYYPPEPAYNRPSWLQLLKHLSGLYRKERNKVEQQAGQLTEIISRSETVFLKDALRTGNASGKHLDRKGPDRIFQHLSRNFDSEFGGFGTAPKFPAAMSLDYLLTYAHLRNVPEALQHLELSLDRMIRGGIYDQLGGGFARYATDRAWLIPHFEKMLYDNALLVRLLADAFRATGKMLYRQTIEETLEFIAREMTSPEGGFYTALDADSEGEEGRYYVWEKKEIDALLADEAALFCDFYGVSAAGNWEGKNILWRQKPLEDFAADRKLSPADLKEKLSRCRHQLLQHRDKRVRPGLDDKILLGWNALQSTAYARAYAALGQEDFRDAAIKNIDFILQHFRQPDSKAFFHALRDGDAQYGAFLDDLAFLIEALIEVYQICFEERYLEEARHLADYVRQHFYDTKSGLFFYTPAEQKDILFRKKEIYDSAVPSGNSTMALNLLALDAFFNEPAYRNLALEMTGQMTGSVEKYPSSFARWALAELHLATPAYQIAVVGKQAGSIAAAVNTRFIPNKIIMAAKHGDERFPLLAGKSGNGETLIYVCEQYSCRKPVATLEEMEKMVNP